MSEHRVDSELLREGFRSYHKAMFALIQFRREVQDLILAVINEHLDELAAAMKLEKSDLNAGLTPYADPDKLQRNWDGLNAEVGWMCPTKPFETRWGIYFYFWIGDEEPGGFGITCWIKQPGVIAELMSTGIAGLKADGNSEAYIWEAIDELPGDFRDKIHRVLDTWIAVCSKVGGIYQFLPAKEGAASRTGK